jgi:hypothetical protein
VNAVTTHGNIFLFDGTLATRRIVPPEWRRINAILHPIDELPTPPPA